MSIEHAQDHYTGRNGRRKLNCAQSVATAFQARYGLPEAVVAGLAACGGGRAPGGECGAFYAARVALEREHADRIGTCEAAFAGKAGSTRCKEIRSLKRLPCPACVSTAAEILDSVRPVEGAGPTEGAKACPARTPPSGPISLERQVRIMAGSIVIIATVLGWLVHPAFAGVAIAIGCGLVYAGATDNCFATMVLAKLPWNRQ